MKKETKMNNKGFSLVELIIVIAIMAILVGVLAPQLLKYIEKTNVSADTQLADAVKSAVTTAIMDPTVINASDASATNIAAFQVAGGAAFSTIDTSTSAFASAVKETLGVSTQAELVGRLRSNISGTASVTIAISSTNQVTVTLVGTDATGKKHTSASSPISVK